MQIIDMDSELELWQLFDPAADRWLETAEHTNWVFRGQADSTWQLLPAAWRTKEKYPLDAIKSVLDETPIEPDRLGNGDNEAEREWARFTSAETIAIEQFIQEAETRGFDTRLSPRQLHRLEDEARNGWVLRNGALGGVPWIHDTALGLAQHHGIPTRALDWSRDPRIALFFALDTANHDKTSIVFCLDAVKLTSRSQDQFSEFNDERANDLGKPIFHIPQAHTVSNEYIRRQRGLLTLIYHERGFFRETCEFPSIESYVNSFSWSASDDPLVAIKIKPEWKPSLCRRLNACGIDKPSLMPTLDNIANLVLSNIQTRGGH